VPAADAPMHANALPRIVPSAGLKVREDTAYSDVSGVEKSGVRKRTERDLQQAAEILARLLRPDEAVLYVARGAAMPTNLEQLFEHGTTASAALLVLTNSRIIALRTKSKGLGGWQWDQGILTAEWGSLAHAATKGWIVRYLDLKDQSGRQERFFRVRRGDAKKITFLLNVLCPQGAIPLPSTQGFTCLCPKCLGALSPGLYRCGQCGLVFKEEKTLWIRALLIPGGAYFYTGQNVVGVFAAFVEAALLFSAIVNVLEAAAVMPAVPDTPGSAPPTPAALITRALMLLLFVLFVKAVGIYRARRRIRKFIPVTS
jgi:hypothetical protein